MSQIKLDILFHANDLPVEWDQMSESIFQKRMFLAHCELYNSCHQRYYVLKENNEIKACACVYTLDIHLFTFSKVPSSIRMEVIGIPASISSPGILGVNNLEKEKLIGEIYKHEKGLILGLNTDPELKPSDSLILNMLPTLELKKSFQSWKNYLDSLRSSYRRRASHIMEYFKGIRKITSDCNNFSDQHYDLYLQIMKHTPSKLELLSLDFFKNLPSNFTLTSYFDQESLICWHITCIDQKKFYFLFGGHDYLSLDYYLTYFNNLFGVLENAFESGYDIIDFGQTAEMAKMKLGAEIVEKRLFLYHHNKAIMKLLRIFAPIISYRKNINSFHVFNKNFITSKSNKYENPIGKAIAIT